MRFARCLVLWDSRRSVFFHSRGTLLPPPRHKPHQPSAGEQIGNQKMKNVRPGDDLETSQVSEIPSASVFVLFVSFFLYGLFSPLWEAVIYSHCASIDLGIEATEIRKATLRHRQSREVRTLRCQEHLLIQGKQMKFAQCWGCACTVGGLRSYQDFLTERIWIHQSETD